jgi:hypothetical protein
LDFSWYDPYEYGSPLVLKEEVAALHGVSWTEFVQGSSSRKTKKLLPPLLSLCACCIQLLNQSLEHSGYQILMIICDGRFSATRQEQIKSKERQEKVKQKWQQDERRETGNNLVQRLAKFAGPAATSRINYRVTDSGMSNCLAIATIVRRSSKPSTT